MMYQVRPNQLLWTNFVGLSPEKILEMGGNLEMIDDWQPSERPLYDSDIKLALRYGIPMSTGIVMDAIHVAENERPRELREVHERAKVSRAHPTIRATDDFIERHLAPGWKQHGDELDKRIDDGHVRIVAEAEEVARQQFEEPVKDDLVAHWRSLGGFVPAE
ncbi:hypothetical protein ACTJJE_05825 [Mycolicibacterium sp. 22603]|uniref:hypothetical protein n=1 Tax=Mycolicibacterium sp. 22603 TaxID=3453950 RepID=UPI003F865CA7